MKELAQGHTARKSQKLELETRQARILEKHLANSNFSQFMLLQRRFSWKMTILLPLMVHPGSRPCLSTTAKIRTRLMRNFAGGGGMKWHLQSPQQP